MRKATISMICATSIIAFVSGCSSHEVQIAPEQPTKYEVLGKAEGSGSGSLGLLATAYNFIPMGLNDRTQRAYDNTIKSVPEATGLINVTYQEDWFWWVLGTNRTVTIKGDAIKEIKE